MKKQAFTLIELLVVIAIIGIIAGLMMPVIGRIREGGRRVTCANNLRQIGIAAHLYIDDHDFQFPDLNSALPSSDVWFSLIARYLDDDNIWNCPDYKYAVPLDDVHSSYAYNWYGLCTASSGYALGADINTIKSPSHCMMLADSILMLGSDEITFSIMERDNFPFWPGNRHSGGANVLFVDGHVGWYLQSFLVAQGEDWWNY